MYNAQRKLNPVHSFQLFCLENYRSFKGISGEQAVSDFIQTGALEYLASGYEVLHTQSRSYILSEVEQFINSRNGTLPRQHQDH
ncbi:MAG TPA: DUF3791 domain-containing protein [Marinilabiliaceae bacterium]|nr:DUF3791 domain-containing protein [Marinilabiliaceae bacterium]HBX88339.1 DUF3791 domain-containing protein [Marinilabiliaceae bacterium]